MQLIRSLSNNLILPHPHGGAQDVLPVSKIAPLENKVELQTYCIYFAWKIQGPDMCIRRCAGRREEKQKECTLMLSYGSISVLCSTYSECCHVAELNLGASFDDALYEMLIKSGILYQVSQNRVIRLSLVVVVILMELLKLIRYERLGKNA